jgi:hypothetical protein
MPSSSQELDRATSLQKLFSWGSGIMLHPTGVEVDIDKILQKVGAEYGRTSLVLKSRMSQPSPLPLSTPEFFMCDLEELLTWTRLYGSRIRRAGLQKAEAEAYLSMTQDLEKTVEALVKHPDYQHGFMRVLVVIS